ncbi:MAG: hypothetical protein JW955_10480 [Sedimentisphaerales bacterium]|nr:hypothetical protein [Sedimentisphaerales bacterium]
MNITRRFRSYFLRGLAVLLPTMLAIWILAWGYGLIQRNVSIRIDRGLVKAQTWVWAQRHEGISRDGVQTCSAPVTGPVIVAPKDETISLDMTVEEAIRFVVSAGVIVPDGRRPTALPAGPVEQEKC